MKVSNAEITGSLEVTSSALEKLTLAGNTLDNSEPLVEVSQALCWIKTRHGVSGMGCVISDRHIMMGSRMFRHPSGAASSCAKFLVGKKIVKVELDPATYFFSSPAPDKGQRFDEAHLDYAIVAVRRVPKHLKEVFAHPISFFTSNEATPSNVFLFDSSFKKQMFSLKVAKARKFQAFTVEYRKITTGSEASGTPLLCLDNGVLKLFGLHHRQVIHKKNNQAVLAQAIICDVTNREIYETIQTWVPTYTLTDALAQTNMGQTTLGWYHQRGLGVAQDRERAAELYQLPAEEGYAPAQNHLGLCYKEAIGVKKNIKRAAELYEMAAEQGEAVAQVNLGVLHESGDGVEKNPRRAAELYQVAVDQGQSKAMYNLGLCYEFGKGVEKNLQRAFELYCTAAKQGHVSAQLNLGFCYENGVGVEKDLKKAFRFYKQSADQGYDKGQSSVGRCYHRGLGVKQDLKRAAKYYQLAANQGNQNAATALIMLAYS